MGGGSDRPRAGDRRPSGQAAGGGSPARAEREWKMAGRAVNRSPERRLIFAGAFPGAYGAVRLASELTPRRHCVACSAQTPRFYMFDRTPAHRLIAGPVSRSADLNPQQSGSIVLKVPAGCRDRLRTAVRRRPGKLRSPEPRPLAFAAARQTGAEWRRHRCIQDRKPPNSAGRPSLSRFTAKATLEFLVERKVTRPQSPSAGECVKATGASHANEAS